MGLIKIYQVDAFTSELFKGNPAAVCLFEEFPEDSVMQSIAFENNLAETAFVKPLGGNQFFIRWFTPCVEVNLCGHATLASSYVLFHHEGINSNELVFQTKNIGQLRVERNADWLVLDFPADELVEIDWPENEIKAMGIRPEAVFKGRCDLLFIYSSQRQIELLQPNFDQLAKSESEGVIATAKGDEVDFVSRYFGPKVGIDEDSVTGSAHTTLTPYWAKNLNKKQLTARQISFRQGELKCELLNDRVKIAGQAKLYLKGQLYLP
ncbi:PhzF family phenazine biosynthesis protein [Carboxylicivirga sp. N1Y90]|uniref:PhzF family phenazine biosynthesis protein n=1 Tax=Carboxylicivirga fragile TaxID=3417571 RepID=UPI003D32D208|nr:PhzF family phenazine biosynthesis protein [Marinilabiliaceae bacterium N1Y90]